MLRAATCAINNRVVNVGESTSLSCPVRLGERLLWQKVRRDGGVTPIAAGDTVTDGSRHRVDHDPAGSGRGKLTLVDATPDAAGRYVCRVEGSAQRRVAEVVVVGESRTRGCPLHASNG